MPEPLLSLVCAMDNKRLIGRDNQLPWHLPADLAIFKKTTLGKPIVMGRKTFESIGKPLPGRRNIVITMNRRWQAPGCDVVYSLEEAIELSSDSEEIMLIGGATLFEQSIERADKLYLTLIHAEFEGDTWFPAFEQSDWQVASEVFFEADHENPHSFTFMEFIRGSC